MAESVNDVQRTIEQARDALTVKRVFGDPVERDGVTVIPAARVPARVPAARARAVGAVSG
jgi:uncharacterized spore protein YtfJ